MIAWLLNHSPWRSAFRYGHRTGRLQGLREARDFLEDINPCHDRVRDRIDDTMGDRRVQRIVDSNRTPTEKE